MAVIRFSFFSLLMLNVFSSAPLAYAQETVSPRYSISKLSPPNGAKSKQGTSEYRVTTSSNRKGGRLLKAPDTVLMGETIHVSYGTVRYRPSCTQSYKDTPDYYIRSENGHKSVTAKIKCGISDEQKRYKDTTADIIAELKKIPNTDKNGRPLQKTPLGFKVCAIEAKRPNFSQENFKTAVNLAEQTYLDFGTNILNFNQSVPVPTLSASTEMVVSFAPHDNTVKKVPKEYKDALIVAQNDNQPVNYTDYINKFVIKQGNRRYEFSGMQIQFAPNDSIINPISQIVFKQGVSNAIEVFEHLCHDDLPQKFISNLQTLLNSNGFDAGEPDGEWDININTALKSLHDTYGTESLGFVTYETMQILGLEY